MSRKYDLRRGCVDTHKGSRQKLGKSQSLHLQNMTRKMTWLNEKAYQAGVKSKSGQGRLSFLPKIEHFVLKSLKMGKSDDF